MDLATAQLIGVTGLLGWVAGAVAVAVWLPIGGLQSLAPRARIRRIGAALVFPVFAAVFLCLLVFSPSVLHAAGVAADHCSVHSHHAFHLCLVHGNAPVSLAALIVVAALVAAGVFRGVHAGSAAWRLHRRLAPLLSLGRPSPDARCIELDSARPLVFTAGYLRPRVVLSSGLRARLDGDELAVVLAHERDHASHRDGLFKLAAQFLAVTHLGTVGVALCRDLERASEEAADAAAAAAVGSPLKVAETLMRVERLLASHGTTSVGFADGDLRHRVQTLLEARNLKTPRGLWVAAFGVAVLGAVAHLDTIHHAVESLVAICL